MFAFRDIPKMALLLGLAGLTPFVWGVVTIYVPGTAIWTRDLLGGLGHRLTGDFVITNYGQIILAFMSGVLWGFSTKAEQPAQAATGYALSVIPALWAFFAVGGGASLSAQNLIFGFVGLLALDFAFWNWRLAPPWWMALRIVLTTVVVLCLLPTALRGLA